VHICCHLVTRMQGNNLKVADIFFENKAQFRYLGTTESDQNFIQEEIKSRLNSGNACYHSSLLLKNIKIRTY
jgi:hypothetical protein